MQLIIKILISIAAVTGTCYIFFCMFLTVVAMPNDKSGYFKYQFQDEPKGFIKYSRILGHIICTGLIVVTTVGIAYLVLFE